MAKTRYIFVVGGVMSGVGKGIAASAIGRILKDYGFRVSAVKIDPYINLDAGTMNPTEHGEVFVTDDGMECDQDVGNYERFLGESITRDNYMTTGVVYKAVIDKERNLEYGGRCVQVVPHIPLEVIARIEKAAKRTRSDFMIVEIGGTIGEYENLLFLEAARMMKIKTPDDVLFVMVSYLPLPSKLGEMKTKPTQHAVRNLNSTGIHADFIIARSSKPLDSVRKSKLSFFCNMPVENIISAPDIDSIYEVPINFEKEGVGLKILKKFKVKAKKKDGKAWQQLVRNISSAKKPVKVAIVGKYFSSGKFTLADSYISVIEAVRHAAWVNKADLKLEWVNAEEFENNPSSVKVLKNYDGVIVPGGFGSRGIEGKIKAIKYVRENKIPFLGLCYGLQLATVEFARNVCGLKNANTTEVDLKTPHPIISTMADQAEMIQQQKNLGGTMRLGAYDCRLAAGSVSRKLYGTDTISERHRHRYEVNNAYRDQLTKAGLKVAGVNPKRDLVEIIELPVQSAQGKPSHPFFLATQFHPELKSRPLEPHPLFVGFIKAALD